MRWGWIVLLGVVGCPREGAEAGGTRSGPTVSIPTPPSSAPQAGDTASEPVDRESWMGRWTSGSCGERKYRRVIELRADGTVWGQDLVSPCPPKVACVWSGIVSFEGSWKLEDGRAVLELEPTTYNDQARALPSELSWQGAPVAVESGTLCRYQADSR